MVWTWIIGFLIIGEVAIYFIFAGVNTAMPYKVGAQVKFGWFFYFLCLSMFSMAGVSLLAYLDTYKRLDQMIVTGDRFLSVLKTTYSIKEMESNQRGYLLTDRDYYFKYYLEKKSLVAERLEEMKKAYEGSARDRDRVHILYNLVQRRVAELGEAVALKKAGKKEETAQRLLIDEGADTTELISISGRDLLTQGVTEHRRMVNEVQSLAVARITLAVVLMIGAVVQVLLSAVVGRARREELADRAEPGEVHERHHEPPDPSSAYLD